MENQSEVTRRLAKYIFIDVVQFSRRSAEAQSDIVKSFNRIVHEVLEQHNVNKDNDNECILIPTGDGMCISLLSQDLPFDSHIQIALSILKSIDEYKKATEDETRKFELRIGINQNTDILVTDINGRKNVAGAGINMASRVMDKADGGQILVSQAVHHELQPSEIYMDKFKKFNATGKHNIQFEVHQFISNSFRGLNIEIPNAFVTPKAKTKKLKEETAHYFAQAIIHKQDILQLKSKVSTYWDEVIIILLKLLAEDSYELSKATEFDDAPRTITEGAGKMSFEEQYTFYKSQNMQVRFLAKHNIVNGFVDDDGLELDQFSNCFEGSDYDWRYEFINSKGKDKLKEDWINIWKEFELDNYV